MRIFKVEPGQSPFEKDMSSSFSSHRLSFKSRFSSTSVKTLSTGSLHLA